MTPVTKRNYERGGLWRWFQVLLLLCAGVPGAAQTTLTVAAAADVQPLMQEMVRNYEAARRESKTKEVQVVFGSSGNLTTQIENGAPYDVFFSADSGFPQRLIREGRATASSFQIYAVGTLVIWVPAGSKVNLNNGAGVLLDPSVQKIAIANPQHAPYGRAAVEALKNLGMYDQVASKLVVGENVAQAAQFVTSGNAQAGIIALSLVRAAAIKDRNYWTVPNLYAPLCQALVIMTHSKHQDEAKAFVDFFMRHLDANLWFRFGLKVPLDRECK